MPTKHLTRLSLIEPECEAKIQDMGFGDEGDLELLVMHDEALEYVQSGNKFEDAVG